MADFNSIVKKTFKFEGGYQAFPNDSANYNSKGQLVGTNHGISAVAYEQYLKRPPSVADIKAITEETARKVYKKLFWDKVQGDLLKNNSVAHLVFDSFIGSGYTGLKQVRKAVNDTAGATVVEFGNKPLTVADAEAINRLPQKDYFETLHDVRGDFFKQLVVLNPVKYGMFLNGWMNRINQINFVPGTVNGNGSTGGPVDSKKKTAHQEEKEYVMPCFSLAA